MASTKPTDYKAEAFAWLGGRIFSGDATEVENSLAALLERLCGEAMKEEQSLHALAQQEWETRFTEAQKEIEWLTTCGVIEVMYSNPNVDSWVKEHEMRLHKAESAIEQAREEGRREQREKDGWLGCGCRSAFVDPTCTMHTRTMSPFYFVDE